MLPHLKKSQNAFIEITSAEHEHGGKGWEFGKCLWVPVRDASGRRKYELMLKPQKNDIVIHLFEDEWDNGVKETKIIGISFVKSKCKIIKTEPPNPGKWRSRGEYYRVDLQYYMGLRMQFSLKNFISIYQNEISAELLEDHPKFYPFNLYRNYVRTVEGMYLTQCTNRLYRILKHAVEINIETSGDGDSETHETYSHLEYLEGRRYACERQFFARNPQLKKAAIRAHGTTCRICGFDFYKTYGEIGKGYVEMHHLNPLSERPESEWENGNLTSVEQVAILCANCHRVVHRTKPPMLVEQLENQMIKQI